MPCMVRRGHRDHVTSRSTDTVHFYNIGTYRTVTTKGTIGLGTTKRAPGQEYKRLGV